MWRGLYAFATDSTGEPITCGGTYTSNCEFYPWPGGSPYAYLPPGVAGDTHIWLGSLPLNQQDETGLAYRRNRYYDPGSGQFTQQDPIGIAGGLNLYGYANGDPINFSDPFGLFACEDDEGNEIPCPEPEGGPPVELPDGKNGLPNSWVPTNPSGTGDRIGKWKPKYPVPSPLGGQPGSSWDPSGHWDVDWGLGGPRDRYLPNGTRVDHNNDPLSFGIRAPQLDPRAAATGISIGAAVYAIISVGSRFVFPWRNLVPIGDDQ
jgi:RHS repeat-associated protein